MIIRLPMPPDFTRPYALLMGSPGVWEMTVARAIEPHFTSVSIGAGMVPAPLALHSLEEAYHGAAVIGYGFDAGRLGWQLFEFGVLLERHRRKLRCLISPCPGAIAEVFRLKCAAAGIRVWEDMADFGSALAVEGRRS